MAYVPRETCIYPSFGVNFFLKPSFRGENVGAGGRLRSVAVGRGRSQSVAVGRGRSRSVAVGRGRSRSVAVVRGRSRSAAIGRDLFEEKL